jgi:hypothetical protein
MSWLPEEADVKDEETLGPSLALLIPVVQTSGTRRLLCDEQRIREGRRFTRSPISLRFGFD